MPKPKLKRKIMMPKKAMIVPAISCVEYPLRNIPIAVIIHPSIAKGKVRSMRYLRPNLSMYKTDIPEPIVLTKARGIFNKRADSAYVSPGIDTPALIKISGP